MNKILNDFVNDNEINANAFGNETLGPQSNNCFNNVVRSVDGENSTCQNQIIETNIDDKIRKAVDNAVMTIDVRMHDAILTGLNNVEIPRVELAARSITGSSGQRPSSVVQNFDRSIFTGNTENTPLISISG